MKICKKPLVALGFLAFSLTNPAQYLRSSYFTDGMGACLQPNPDPSSTYRCFSMKKL